MATSYSGLLTCTLAGDSECRRPAAAVLIIQPGTDTPAAHLGCDRHLADSYARLVAKVQPAVKVAVVHLAGRVPDVRASA